MDFTICYLEIFDEETNQWEYVANSKEPEVINMWCNNLESFFDEFNLSFLFTDIENQQEQVLFTNYKGLPTDCSTVIQHCYWFHFEEVKMCSQASFLNLYELLTFDYSKTISLKEISKTNLKLMYPEIYSTRKKSITHREWLGEEFFNELQKTNQRFVKYPNCRIIYFIYDINLV